MAALVGKAMDNSVLASIKDKPFPQTGRPIKTAFPDFFGRQNRIPLVEDHNYSFFSLSYSPQERGLKRLAPIS